MPARFRIPLLMLAALTLGLSALPQAARADSLVIVHNGPYPYGPHGPYYGPAWHRRPEVVVVEPPPPPVVIAQPAPVVVAPPPVVAAAPAAPAPAPQGNCREYQTQTVIGGQVKPSYGTACLQPDGSWKIVSQTP